MSWILGYGWFSIHILNAYTYGEVNGKTCKWNPSHGCDPYFILYINDKEVLKTAKKVDKFFSEVDKTFTSAKIARNSIIKLEIWDASSGFWEKDALILRSEGDVDSFLNEPLRNGIYVLGGVNAIETISFWADDYKQGNIALKNSGKIGQYL